MLQSNKTEKEANTRDLSAHTVVQCITTLCSGTGISSEETNLLLLEALFPAHHPLVVTAAPELWTKVVKYHKISPSAFVIQQRAYVKKELIEGYKVNAVIFVFFFLVQIVSIIKMTELSQDLIQV